MKIDSLRPNRKARIEIIPLIDIMFFLLATFVMVSLTMVKTKGVPVNLPKAVSGEKVNPQDFTTVSVTADGKYFIDKTEVRADFLAEEFRKLKSANTDPKVYVKADTDARFGEAVAVLDGLRNAGISKIAIETKQQEKA